jgi:hypothetical protein
MPEMCVRCDAWAGTGCARTFRTFPTQNPDAQGSVSREPGSVPHHDVDAYFTTTESAKNTTCQC